MLQVAAERASVPHQQSAAITGGSSFTFTDEELIVFIAAPKQSVRPDRPALPEMLQERARGRGRSTQTLERLESDTSRSYLTEELFITENYST